jgi:hypothetical protein
MRVSTTHGQQSIDTLGTPELAHYREMIEPTQSYRNYQAQLIGQQFANGEAGQSSACAGLQSGQRESRNRHSNPSTARQTRMHPICFDPK